ncbi:hypothetical protein BX600DRAFT_509605 [Xylariales sp. PMI_506]|nr:hypothetical protein BX600DRAFT_509605 [Xylariales sp. PMI_506]
MAYQAYTPQVPQDAHQRDQNWARRDSNIPESPYDDTPLSPGHSGHRSPIYGYPLAGTEHDSEHVYTGGSTWPGPLASSGGQYQPISNRRQSVGDSQYASQGDDRSAMSLLKAVAPMGVAETYAAVPDEEPVGALFDMTSFSGPMGQQDHEFIKSLQEQEASGKLTGGLGTGLNPDSTIRSDELLASPTLNRSFSRSLSFRQKPDVDRRRSIKGLGQIAANKTGAVIEVIIEEPSEVDLSNITGPTPFDGDSIPMRQSTIPNIAAKTEIFYPQPNWKPFSMRWPYLLGLIILSLGLAVGQEFLYRQSAKTPLMSFKNPAQINPFDYFVLKFLPTIVTVTYGVLWSMTDVEVKRLEAFYQMSKEGGALAAESINVDYITLFQFTRPFRAFQRKHYAVAVSSITALLAVSLIPTLGSAAVVLNPDSATRNAKPDVLKYITISPVMSRLLSCTFVVIAVLGMVLFYQLQSRRSGLLADVKGIAGLASMAVVSHIMMDFKDMDVAKPKDIHHRLKNHRYVLRNSSLAPDDATPVTTQESDRYREAHLPENPHPLMLRAGGAIPFIFGILLFLGFIPVFLFTPVSALTDKAPWVVTALAICLKLGWGGLETSIRMMEPYYILSKRHAPPKILTLDYTAMPFAWVAVRGLLNRHWLVFLVGFGTVLTETLTIFVTSLATVEGKDFINEVRQAQQDPNLPISGEDSNGFNSGQETVRSFVVSLGFTAFILVYMFIVATMVFVRRRHPFLPRQPNTIASILAFMHQSKMLYDFVGTAKFTNAQMVHKLEDIGKTYGLGWFVGRDGQTHCGVDEEELTGNYKHGIDYSQGNRPWDREWQLF